MSTVITKVTMVGIGRWRLSYTPFILAGDESKTGNCVDLRYSSEKQELPSVSVWYLLSPQKEFTDYPTGNFRSVKLKHR